MNGEPVTYEFYERFKDVYSSKTLKVKYNCVACNAEHVSDFKHLNKRTVVKEAYCPKCVMRKATSDEGWRRRNSEAQLKIQSLPETKKKNAESVSRYWRENPDKLESMRQSLLLANQRPEVKARRRAVEIWNGRGISGDYLSKWGWLHFDSSYELAFIVALEENPSVLKVNRGPLIEYEYLGRNRTYHMDFEVIFVDNQKWWAEIKSGYIGGKRHSIDVLRAKLGKTLELVRQGHADKVVLVTEKNSNDLFNFVMPRGAHRNNLFRKYYDKIIFADEKHEERYK